MRDGRDAWSRLCCVLSDPVIRAPIPTDELPRLRELASYDILDSDDEPQFDALVRLAAQILGVPTALISLIDADRQWFKARYGLDARQTPRDTSFCGHVVASQVAVVVRDAHEDPRFFDNPFVVGAPHVRFYAGMPLASKDGFVLGTLCAIDLQPRELSEVQLDCLRTIADQVMALLELRRIGRELRNDREILCERERQLADRQRRLAMLFASMSDGVVLQDRSGTILEHNAPAAAILGLSPDQLVGRTSMDPRWSAVRADGTPFPGDEHPAMIALRTGEACDNVIMGVHFPHGELRWISATSRPLREADGELPYAAITTFRDVTAQRVLDQRVARNERLITTGILAAGVGHEINNPLAYAMSNITLALEELHALGGARPTPRITEIVEMLVQAQEGGARVHRIVRGLKSLGRDDGEPCATDLRGVLEDALELTSHETRARATTVLELADLPPVWGEAARLTQVLANLIVNAAQAFTSNAVETNRIVIRTLLGEGHVVIEVADNGPGIAAAVLPRIFDPFFTTKSPKDGAGLGLSISHGLVVAFGGELTCQTEVGRGSTFRIVLPVAPSRATEPVVAGPVALRLLVIDDEAAILQTIQRMLRKQADVVTTSDPREALQRIARGEVFDLVLCDILMAHMNGIELYGRVLAVAPATAARFVFMSGDFTREDIAQFLAGVPNRRIEKPFSVAALRSIVAALAQA